MVGCVFMPGTLLSRAIQRLRTLSDEPTTAFGISLLELTTAMKGAERKLARVATISSREQILDSLAELRFAACFAGLGFDVEFEPCGEKGPDFQVRRAGNTAVVEVTRFVKMYDGPPVFSESDLYVAGYGDIERDVTKARKKITSKFRQVGEDVSIIAIWNDDQDMEETHVLTAVNMIQDDAATGLDRVPSGLVFVLYASDWMRVGGQQLYCYPPSAAHERKHVDWMQELEGTTVREALRKAKARLV
jgi:hypothetical protein